MKVEQGRQQPDDGPAPGEPEIGESCDVSGAPRIPPSGGISRISYPAFRDFARCELGHLEATREMEEPHSLAGRFWRLLIGMPLSTEMESQERLSKLKALAVFSSDALSSVAYAPGETLVILVTAGAAAVAWSLPISIAIVFLLTIVVTSYRQTIYTYPSGGGSYIVAHANLGETPGLVAAAALVLGYILTVSVSIASAVDQLVSASPPLLPLRVPLAVAAIALMTILNLRGIRESGNIFALPTYVFLATMCAMIGTGLFQMLSGHLAVPSPAPGETPLGAEPLTLFLLLRAFAVGSAVMTGTEAISNGIPAFKPPEPRNAARTLVSMAAILGTMFLGLSILVVSSGLVPVRDQTLVSLLAHGVFGDGPLYFLVQGSAALILVLAANTAYADFPRLASLLARDDYAPHQLALRGERLAFSNGIVLLGLLSTALVIMFGGSTGALLPLYAVSVFAAFTLSQSGMTRHWLRERGPGWRTKAAVNGFGAILTAAVVLIAASTNFMDRSFRIVPWVPVGYGSWLVLLIVPAFVMLFMTIRRHYGEAERNTALPPPGTQQQPLKNIVVVPVSRLHQPTYQALRYARSICADAVAVHIAIDPRQAEVIERDWEWYSQGVPLTVIDSPYRSLTRPLLYYLVELRRLQGADIVTVLLPEYVPDSWWEQFLHGQSAQLLKLMLLFRPGFVVTSVPSHERQEVQTSTEP